MARYDRPPGSPAGSVWSDDGADGKFAVPMQRQQGVQSALLKRISAFRTKEELLGFVASYSYLLDTINLVTALYRLAKMSFGQRSRNTYLMELQRSPTFQLLLRSISAQFMHAQLQYMQHRAEPRGVDARCLANLVWALAKLDLSSDEAALSTEIALNCAPFVLRSLDNSSPQGLANMLWSYAKLPVAPPPVVAALAGKIASELTASLLSGSEDAKPFDAQALSNSIWALAHLKSRGLELEAFGATAVAFLEAVAVAATRMLTRLQQQLLSLPRGPGGTPDAGQLLAAAEADFSCQALVNIAWALATIAGPACGTHAPFRALFAVVNAEAVGRLRATAALLRARAPLPYHGGGQGFNEQALSNACFAFDRAGLLQHDLLAAIFDVATLRLQLGAGPGAGGGSHDGGGISFKPQELCSLLKACHTGAAPPWAFLATLLRALSLNPSAVDGWSAAEKAELQGAYLLFSQHQAAAAAAQGAAADAALLAQIGVLQVQQAQAQAQQQQAAAAVAALQQQHAQLQQQQQSALAALAAQQQQQQMQQGGTPRAGAARPPRGGPRPQAATPPPPFAGFPAGASFDGAPAFVGGGGSSGGASPRTPAGAGFAGFGGGAQSPAAEAALNRSARARLAHAPQAQQASLFEQTQARLAGEGLTTSTAGSLWAGGNGGGGNGNGGGMPAGMAAGLPPGLVGGAGAGGGEAAPTLRPWLDGAGFSARPPAGLAGGGARF
ncbi:hypothetical protein Rsub_04185 [Raphidocelis subcapitata]|uniref:Uncharacterized protein n=1 Tax=Raphidocelis subcapitata TaxID=307507 RepID=A0A2V0P2Z0_9CHLO|nr:hypothetical protein Rsub_04185 [Raphidocelis subcapitata]|eukprot:GBF91445.1 hypothetical protein Rsub_04185 [Raphidocelis subcapitata]